jgi:HEAT repeat protein
MYPSPDSTAGTRGATSTATIDGLIRKLASSNGLERRDAREHLVELGGPAVEALIEALKSPHDHARWEAAKALGEMRDPRAAAALVDALQDKESAVRWLAAKGLIALGRSALVPLLRALEYESDSAWMREGARHVLHSLIRDGVAEEAEPVLEALEDIEPSMEAPKAAQTALRRLGAETEDGRSI